MTRFVSYNLFVFQKVNIMVACCFPYHSWQYITLYLGTDASHKPERKLHFLDNNFSAFQNPFRSKHHNGHRANCLSVCWSSPKFLRLLMVTAPFSTILWGFHCPLRWTNVEKKWIVTISKNAKAQGPFETSFEYKENTGSWKPQQNPLQAHQEILPVFHCHLGEVLGRKMPSKSLRDVYPNSIASP